jgi:hypothetical protein
MKVVWSRSGCGLITGASFASLERRGDRWRLHRPGAVSVGVEGRADMPFQAGSLPFLARLRTLRMSGVRGGPLGAVGAWNGPAAS